MRVENVAVLAITLLLLTGLPGEGTSLPVTNERQRARLRRPRRQQRKFPPTFVLIVSGHRPSKMEDFGNHFPSTGRFCPHHKMGRKLIEEGGGTPQLWSIAIAALATSGAAIAKPTSPQASPPLSPSHVGREEVGGYRSWGTRDIQKRRLPPQQHQAPKQRGRRRRRRQRAHDDNDHAVGWPASPLKELRAQASSKWGVVVRWSSKRCKPLRKTVSAYRPHVFANRPSRRLLTRRRKIDWATMGIAQLASQISNLTVEARRRTGDTFSAVRVCGESGILYLYESIMRRGLVEEFDAASENINECGQQNGGSRLLHLTDTTVQNVVDVVARDGWEHVVTTSGVVVHRQYIALDPDGTPIPSSAIETEAETVVEQVAAAAPVTAEATPAVVGRGLGVTDDKASRRTPRFACVKASAILSAPPEVVYLLFTDNSRVTEYNEHCKEVMDLEILSPDTKITWAASGRIGPFKARDFCTLVHFRTLSDGTLAQVSRPVEHPSAPRSNQYVRSEILLAGNFMRAVPGDPSRTEFLMVTHVNPGGAAETRAGAMLVNSLCATSPVIFIRRLDTAAQKLMHELQESAGAESDRIVDSTALSSTPPLHLERATLGGISEFEDESKAAERQFLERLRTLATMKM